LTKTTPKLKNSSPSIGWKPSVTISNWTEPQPQNNPAPAGFFVSKNRLARFARSGRTSRQAAASIKSLARSARSTSLRSGNALASSERHSLKTLRGRTPSNSPASLVADGGRRVWGWADPLGRHTQTHTNNGRVTQAPPLFMRGVVSHAKEKR
jgi:hypothetical protein